MNTPPTKPALGRSIGNFINPHPIRTAFAVESYPSIVEEGDLAVEILDVYVTNVEPVLRETTHEPGGGLGGAAPGRLMLDGLCDAIPPEDEYHVVRES